VVQALSVALKGFVKPVLDSLALPESNARELLKAVSFLLAATTSATNELRAQFLDTPNTVMSSLTHPLFQPFERFISRYAELEGVVVNEEVCCFVSCTTCMFIKGLTDFLCIGLT
jgi:hypothetical protein